MIFSGSYLEEDVEFLLKVIDINFTSIEEKEKLIQSGKSHYSEMINQEYEPTEAYLKTYIKYLYDNRDRFFGNARSIRKIVEKSTRNHELRMADLSKKERTKKMMSTLSVDDVKEFEPSKNKMKKRSSMGYKFGG